MQIVIHQIANGWIVTVIFPSKGSSSLYCTNFEDVVKELTNMKDAAIREHKQNENKSGVNIPK